MLVIFIITLPVHAASDGLKILSLVMLLIYSGFTFIPVPVMN